MIYRHSSAADPQMLLWPSDNWAMLYLGRLKTLMSSLQLRLNFDFKKVNTIRPTLGHLLVTIPSGVKQITFQSNQPKTFSFYKSRSFLDHLDSRDISDFVCAWREL